MLSFEGTTDGGRIVCIGRQEYFDLAGVLDWDPVICNISSRNAQLDSWLDAGVVREYDWRSFGKAPHEAEWDVVSFERPLTKDSLSGFQDLVIEPWLRDACALWGTASECSDLQIEDNGLRLIFRAPRPDGRFIMRHLTKFHEEVCHIAAWGGTKWNAWEEKRRSSDA